jgi:hypothetical protein
MHRSAPNGREMQVLDLWERAVGLDRWRRDDALLAVGHAAPRGLGARNAALLALRNALFDRAWPLQSRCPACAAECEFQIDSLALAEELNRFEAAESATFEWAGVAIVARPPNADDLRAISLQTDTGSAVRALLARCLSGELTLAEADDAAVEELGRRLERLDPGAAVGFALRCPACDHTWSAMVDVGDALWTELQRAAERSLVEIDALARAYGWTEDEVIRLSPTRRAAYLQLVGGS